MYIVFVLLVNRLVWALFQLIKCLVFVCNDEIIWCYVVVFFFVLIAKGLAKKTKRFLELY